MHYDSTRFMQMRMYIIFVRSGSVLIHIGELMDSGTVGCAWSSSSRASGINAHRLDFNGSIVGPSYDNDRWNGFPLRCLAN